MNWMNEVETALAPAAAPVAAAPKSVTAAQLTAAAQVFEQRGRTQNAATCRDMAAKLARFGSFISQKQADYAGKLCEWAGTENPHHPANVPAKAPVAAPAEPTYAYPATAALFAPDRFSRFSVGPVALSRSNDGSIIWIKFAGYPKVVGKMVPGTGSAAFFPRIKVAPADYATLLDTMAAIEKDPRAAAAQDGIRTGRCSCCGRELTDPVSIGLGIGPICLAKF